MEKSIRNRIAAKLRSIGFTHIAVDMEGYIQGSMNRDIESVAAEK
jgi:PP-loop superfamily ATP-utilizing enzyme